MTAFPKNGALIGHELHALTRTLISGRSYMQTLRGKRIKGVEKKGGAFGDLSNDTELRVDKLMGERVARDLLSTFPNIRSVTVEGGEDKTRDVEGYWATVDPIDGSLNYLHAGPMLGFPYTLVITLLRTRYGTTFKDVIAAGVADIRPGMKDLTLAEWSNEKYLTYAVGYENRIEHAATLKVDKLNLGQMNVIGEFYYPENRERLVRAFAGEKGWLRNPGSAAYEMASVATGQAAAYICDRQKQHELGAAYALVKGAGGVVIDWEGKDIGKRIYDFKTQIPVILAANEGIADQILERLNRS
jgi:myo-inositol-1(or 4)-monophosphatase